MAGSGKALTSQDPGFEALYPGTSQSVAIGAASVQSTTFAPAKTSIIRLFSTVDCFLAFGPNPTANTTTGYFLPGGIIDFVGVTPGTIVAVIQKSAIGVLYITEGG